MLKIQWKEVSNISSNEECIRISRCTVINKKKKVVKRTAKYDQRFFTIINAEYRKSHEQDNRKICPDVFDKNASSGQN